MIKKSRYTIYIVFLFFLLQGFILASCAPLVRNTLMLFLMAGVVSLTLALLLLGSIEVYIRRSARIKALTLVEEQAMHERSGEEEPRSPVSTPRPVPKKSTEDAATPREIEEQGQGYISDTYWGIAKELKEAKEALGIKNTQIEEEKHKVEVILRSVPEGMVTVNLGGVIQTWNPGAEKITSWLAQETTGKSFERFLPLRRADGSDFPVEELPLFRCARSKSVVELKDIFLVARRGGQIPIDMTAAPILDEKCREVTEVVIVFRDISKQWEIERMKEDFLAMVTHDLKSPLAAIVGYTEILLHPKSVFSAEMQKDFLESIMASVKILQFLIDNLLETARLEAGRIVYQPEDFDLKKLMEEITRMFDPLVSSKSITLDCQGDELWINADREKIREVINNLIGNAIKFTPHGGKITVRWAEADKRIEVKVRDSGKGIPRDELPRLFQKFVQVKEEKRGTGLGLYICRRILEDHGQKIRVTSEVGSGTEFTFTLSPGVPQVSMKPLEEIVSMPASNFKILIVEDDQEVSNLIRFYLRQEGYRTVQAFRASDVPDLMGKEKPDLITLDYNLPDMNGEELVKRMLLLDQLHNTPILVITSHKRSSWDIPYDGLLLKPINEERLLSEVRRLTQIRAASAKF